MKFQVVTFPVNLSLLVEKGFKASMQNGVLAGYQLQSLKIVLTDGSYHDVDSDSLSFEICARTASVKLYLKLSLYC
jgi:translation elongation factor EF-G